MVAGCVTIVAFDTVWALLADGFDLSYQVLWPLSFLIYGATAFVAARQVASARAGALAGSFVAMVDAAIGWPISWAIGPGRLDDPSVAEVVATALLAVPLTGAIVGFFAGALAQRFARTAAT